MRSECEQAIQEWKPSASDFIPGATSLLMLPLIGLLLVTTLKQFPLLSIIAVIAFLFSGVTALGMLWVPLFGSGRSVRTYLRLKAWVAAKPLRQNNLVICNASRHKGPQQNTLNCTGYFGAAPNPHTSVLTPQGLPYKQ